MSSVVLITGATGFVGGASLARLLGGHSLVALVRGRNQQHAQERLALSLARFLAPAELSNALLTVKVVAGDLGSQNLHEAAELEAVTHVLHSAACTSFASDREVWRTNVEGTERLAEVVGRLPSLRRFLHVSTAYCCGQHPNSVVLEGDSPRPEHRHVNEYTRSKAAAELRLRAMGWGERLIVARPSIVVGHTKLGVAPSSSLFWYYRAVEALRVGPFALDDRRDVVPVDYVADALQFLLTLERPRFDTYHVSAGAGGSDTVADVLRALSPSRSEAAPRWRRLDTSTYAESLPQLRALVRSHAEARKLARGFRACAELGAIDVQFFDNGRLLSEGFRAPPRFVDYAELCLRTSGEATIFDQMIDDT